MELLQIEEPGERRDEFEDQGLAIGLELTGGALRLAASVGGNVELIRNAAGGIDFLPAVAGYDAAGTLVAGSAGLADPSGIGLEALAAPELPDARGTAVADRLGLLIARAGREVIGLTGRMIGGAVVVVPLESGAALRLALMQAIEAGGIPVRRLVESSVALAWGGGLEARGDGVWLHLAPLPTGLALAWLETADGAVRLVGGAAVRHVDEVAGLIAAEGPVAGLIAPGIEAAGAIAAASGVKLLDGFDGAERAVIGAARLAEALG
jgi:hypothetical protein